MKPSARDIVTPAVVGLFLFIAISGLGLFFHVGSGFFHSAHEWLGLLFAAAALWHGLRYWKNIAGYWNKGVSRAVMTGMVALSLGFAGVSLATSGQGGNPRQVLQAMEHASLGNAALALGKSPTEAIALLKSKGIEASETQQISELAEIAHLPPTAVLLALIPPQQNGKGGPR